MNESDNSVEGISVSRTAIFNFIVKFKKTDFVTDITQAPRSSKLNEDHYRFVDELMTDKPDLTSRQLCIAFKEVFPSVDVSTVTIERAHQKEQGTAN